MIILDTNVISEAMKPSPDQRVIDWLDAQVAEHLFTTSITLAELIAGIARLQEGKRKRGLRALLDEIVGEMIGWRVLSFDADAAIRFASVSTVAAANGHSIGFPDGQIAAIAQAQGFSVASRDEHPFKATGTPLINPWVS